MATVQCFEYVNPGGSGFKLAPDQQFYFTIGSNAAFANGAITVTAHPTSGDVPSGLYMEVIQTATRFMPTIGGPTYYLDVSCGTTRTPASPRTPPSTSSPRTRASSRPDRARKGDHWFSGPQDYRG